ncbi:hypothetical protein [Dyella japonica]|uniref:Uncharacterized protein n=1 Tax=Dyella japonica DSM 16301 TaxID=1440762 RepID=A0A0G9H6I9_9GAMM|nr:hypothetical protein [Dyella japonica]KLD65455.1 hypothetical protein Y882_02785 [Dyella japonica DSM 16301]
MAEMKQAVEITAKLYRIRDAAKFMLGDKYKAEMAEWRQAIEQVAAARQVTPLGAATLLGKKLIQEGSEYAFLSVMAAYVEMAEPSIEATEGSAA